MADPPNLYRLLPRLFPARFRGKAEADEAKLLAKTFPAPWGGSKLSLFQHLLRMIAHLAQHKGQLFYYLKLMGQRLNTSDLWGV